MERNGRILTRCCVLLLTTLCGLNTALSQCTSPGCLDISFGPAGNGEVVTPIAGYTSPGISKLVILQFPQPFGSVLYKIGAAVSAYPAGSPTAVFGAARYNLDGTLDTSFGTNGLSMTSVGGYVNGAAAQPDGKLLVVGSQSTLVRFATDGSLDPTFGSGGVVTLSSRKIIATFKAIGLQDDGRIVVAGTYGSAMAAWRFNSNGSLDNTFGTNGMASITPANITGLNVLTVALQYAGGEQRILLGGDIVQQQQQGHRNATIANFAIVRLTASGQADNTFGTNGTVIQGFGSNAQVWSLAVDSSNNVIAGGLLSPSTSKAFLLARYHSDGTPDSTFGTGGVVTWQSAANAYSYLQAVALQSDGRILACGWVGGVESMTVVRFASNGALDTTFGSNGVVTNTFAASGGVSANALTLAIQPTDGKIVIGGSVGTTLNAVSELGLARYYP